MTAIPSSEVLILLASIREALDVPYPAGDASKEERQARRDTLDQRVSDVKATLTGILSIPVDELARSAEQLREWTKDSPITYRAFREVGEGE